MFVILFTPYVPWKTAHQETKSIPCIKSNSVSTTLNTSRNKLHLKMFQRKNQNHDAMDETSSVCLQYTSTNFTLNIISHLSFSLVLTNLTYFAHWNDSFSFVFHIVNIVSSSTFFGRWIESRRDSFLQFLYLLFMKWLMMI